MVSSNLKTQEDTVAYNHYSYLQSLVNLNLNLNANNSKISTHFIVFLPLGTHIMAP